ncbi:MAG: hypothetical protein RQ866_08820, partial [Bacteroidales bacterium]|nr:hypothetical protein [Bacteroidales bacterium]
LVPDTITGKNTNVLGFWYTNSDTIPAIIQNRFGRGTSYLFPGSDFLHPAGEGGVWSADKISIFYTFVLRDFHQKNNIPVSLNPWPDGHGYAFCMTFNTEGTLSQYQQLTNYLENRNIEPVFFVSGRVPDDIRTFINDGGFNTGSTGFRYQNYRNTMFPDAVDDIIANEVSWEKKFKGFRFPYTQAGYWGLLALEENNYEYVSSIGVNNIEFFHGAAFPYNLVIAKNQYYKTTDLLEVGPIYHDDYFFLNESCNEDEDNPQLGKDIDLYNKYLSNFWERAIKPYNGLMVYLGHPAYVGFNDQTIAILDSLILRVSNDDTWMTNICDVVSFRKNLASMRFYVKTDDKKIVVTISAPQEIKLNGVTLNINNTVDFKKVSAASGKAVIKNEKLYQQVVFDAFDGQEIIISR